MLDFLEATLEHPAVPGRRSAAAGFDDHTAVMSPDSEGLTAQLSGDTIGFGGGVHGGYLTAIALRAMATMLPVARPARSVSLALLTPVRPGSLALLPRLLRQSPSSTTVTLTASQQGQQVLTGRAVFGHASESLDYLGLEMPGVPGPAECAPVPSELKLGASAMLLVEHRPAAPPLPLTGSDRAELQMWMRLNEERPLDELALAMIADAGPPALYATLDRYIAMPSYEISIHFSGLAIGSASPWLLGVFRTGFAAGGYASEDGALWTEDGQLAARSQQLRRILGNT
jgi:acyl-CoA thioesterase